MNYDDMSGFEINKAVAKALGFKSDSIRNLNTTNIAIYQDGRPMDLVMRDYCNNPADAWLIIVGNRIGLHPNDDGSYKAFTCMIDSDNYDREENHDNPLVCAMIVFLKMKDTEQ